MWMTQRKKLHYWANLMRERSCSTKRSRGRESSHLLRYVAPVSLEMLLTVSTAASIGSEEPSECSEGYVENSPIQTTRCVDLAHNTSSKPLALSAFITSHSESLSADKLQSRFPPNIVRNQKYNTFTFLPLVFYEQFKFFFNLYFLLVALSQFVPALKIGNCSTSQNDSPRPY